MRIKHAEHRAMAIAEAVVGLKVAEHNLATVRLDGKRACVVARELDEARDAADKVLEDLASKYGFPADPRKVTFDADGTVLDRATGQQWVKT